MNTKSAFAIQAAILLFLQLSAIGQQSPDTDSVPHVWIETTELAPDRNFESLVFETIPGVDYTVQTTTDLLNWETLGSGYYGLGHQVTIPMFERVGSEPPPESPENAENPLTAISIIMSKAIGGGVLISFRSVASGTAVTRHLPNVEPSEDWSWIPLYFSPPTSGYVFVVLHSGFETTPPSQPQPLEINDQSVVNVFEGNFAVFDNEVQQSILRSAIFPPPSNQSGEASRFYRVISNPYLDTDGDGSPDWLEILEAGSSTPGSILGNPFNGDANNNGVADGQESDKDSDGAPNSQDVAPDDKDIDWQKDDHLLFAFFPVTGTGAPLQVNDQGRVLFEQTLWTNGQSVQLDAADGTTLTDCYPLGIGDGGFLLGIGKIDLPGDQGNAKSYCMVTWPTTGGSPVAIRSGENYLAPVTIGFRNPRIESYPPPSDMAVNKDGKFIAHSATVTTEHPSKVLSHDAGGPWIWSTANNSATATKGASVPLRTAWIIDTNVTSGTDQEGKFKIGDKVFAEQYTRAALLPGGKLAALNSQDRTVASVLSAGTWNHNEIIERAIDVSSEGKFVLRTSWHLWHNGNSHLRRAGDAIPGLSGWDDPATCSFLDATKHGWTLASKQGSQPMLGLPIILSDDVVGTGLDTHSAMASDSNFTVEQRAGNKDEFWVMVPGGGSTQFRFRSPATSTTPVEIGTPSQISAAPSSINSSDTLVTLSAPQVEQEFAVSLKVGNVASASIPLRAKVMKARVLNVTVWPLTRPGRPVGDPPNNPPALPTELEIETALNGIFQPQINATFDVTIKPSSAMAAADPGGIFSVDEPPTAQQKAIAERGDDAHIQAFIMGGYDSLLATLPYGGWANRENKWIWLATQRLAEGNKEAWLNTFAHEIGHILFGPGHPDNIKSPGPAGLPLTNHGIRLMNSGFTTTTPPPMRKLVVKGEWDAAQSWFESNFD